MIAAMLARSDRTLEWLVEGCTLAETTPRVARAFKELAGLLDQGRDGFRQGVVSLSEDAVLIIVAMMQVGFARAIELYDRRKADGEREQ